MRYFLDTEFIEGTQTKRILGIPYGKTKPTIDLISIGVVAEDGREYYAISRDFNLDEAWNRYQIENEWIEKTSDFKHTVNKKVYWLRDNVLRPIFDDLIKKEEENYLAYIKSNYITSLYNESCVLDTSFTKRNFGYLISKYGKSNKEIANDIKEFVYNTTSENKYYGELTNYKSIDFYGYYADYDWVVFCWLFGRMIDLPNGFPMYCIDLKQTLDEKVNNYHAKVGTIKKDFESTLKDIKSFDSYPKQTNEHNALSDARWTRDLYNFLNQL